MGYGKQEFFVFPDCLFCGASGIKVGQVDKVESKAFCTFSNENSHVWIHDFVVYFNKMTTLIENVLVTTYVTPHLFWVIELKNEKRYEQIAYLKRELKKINENNDSSADNQNCNFEVGQVNNYLYISYIPHLQL